MKKIFYLTFIILSVISLLCACSKTPALSESSLVESIENRILILENKLAAISSFDASSSDMTSSALSQSPSSEFSDTEKTLSAGFSYSVDGNRATITGYYGEQTALVIPATIDGYRVVAIADSAFKGMHIKSVIVSDGVESIGWFAFEGCAYLTSITLPKSISSIAHGALGSGSSLTVFCHSDSFAVAYAKSYGLTYVII